VPLIAAVVLATAGSWMAFGASPAETCPIVGDVSYGDNNFMEPRDGGSRHHKGEDIGAETGTPLYAPEGGTITRKWDGAGYGNYVVIEADDGSEYLYGHMDSVAPTVSDGRVEEGEVVGTVGNTGAASRGSHLHIEQWEGGALVDPNAHVLNQCREPGQSRPAAPSEPAQPPPPEPNLFENYESCRRTTSLNICGGLPGAPQTEEPFKSYEECRSATSLPVCDSLPRVAQAPTASYCPPGEESEYCERFGVAPAGGVTPGSIAAFVGDEECANNPGLEQCSRFGVASQVFDESTFIYGGDYCDANPYDCGRTAPQSFFRPDPYVGCENTLVWLGQGGGECENKLRDVLQAEGYDPDKVENGADAVQLFQFRYRVPNSGCDFDAGPETCDGVVGPATTAVLNAAGSDSRFDEREFIYGGDYCDANPYDCGRTAVDDCERNGNCSTIQLPPTYNEDEFIYGGDYCDANPQDCRGERGYGVVLCADAPSDPNCYTPPPPNYNEDEYIYGGDYCDANPNDCGATNEPGYEGYYEDEYIYGGDYCDANPNDCGATNEPGYEGYYEDEYIYGGDYCDANPNDCGATNEPGYEGYYEEEYIYGGDYCDARPRDCDPSYEGGYEGYYEEEYIYGGDYCDENPYDCGEPGYENSYEGGYEGYYEEEYIYGGDYCDENPYDCGEPGYENSYEGGYEGYYEEEYIYGGDYCDMNPGDCGGEGGYENGYEGYYEGYYGGAQQY
jgi:hypothetical protein